MNRLKEEEARAIEEYEQAKRIFYEALESWENAKVDVTKAFEAKQMILRGSSMVFDDKRQALNEIDLTINLACERERDAGRVAQHTHDAMEVPRQRMINAIMDARFLPQSMNSDRYPF
jgi:hypothetical protein